MQGTFIIYYIVWYVDARDVCTGTLTCVTDDSEIVQRIQHKNQLRNVNVRLDKL